jgi:hypothetical protein
MQLQSKYGIYDSKYDGKKLYQILKIYPDKYNIQDYKEMKNFLNEQTTSMINHILNRAFLYKTDLDTYLSNKGKNNTNQTDNKPDNNTNTIKMVVIPQNIKRAKTPIKIYNKSNNITKDYFKTEKNINFKGKNIDLYDFMMDFLYEKFNGNTHFIKQYNKWVDILLSNKNSEDIFISLKNQINTRLLNMYNANIINEIPDIIIIKS